MYSPACTLVQTHARNKTERKGLMWVIRVMTGVDPCDVGWPNFGRYFEIFLSWHLPRPTAVPVWYVFIFISIIIRYTSIQIQKEQLSEVLFANCLYLNIVWYWHLLWSRDVNVVYIWYMYGVSMYNFTVCIRFIRETGIEKSCPQSK